MSLYDIFIIGDGPSKVGSKLTKGLRARVRDLGLDPSRHTRFLKTKDIAKHDPLLPSVAACLLPLTSTGEITAVTKLVQLGVPVIPIKALTGNPGKRPLNPAELNPEPAMPECPAELGPVARREWDRLVGELAALRLLTNLDRAALAAYCGAYALWAEAMEAIQKYGTMIKSPTGYPIQSPYVAIANRQAEIMMRIASEFGFTPASRSRVSIPSNIEPTLFDALDADRGEAGE